MRLLCSNEYVKVDGDRFDVLKFILALCIIGIHTDLSYVLKPIFRLAVPLFFMMTSYFFFLKQDRLESLEAKKSELKKYCKRILQLYLFWFILLLPLTVFFNKWYVGAGPGLLVDVLQSFMFGNTFKASWFLMASLLGIVLVWYLSRWFKFGTMIIIGIVLYAFCCLTSNYYHLCEHIPYFTEFFDGYMSVFKRPYHSFPVAFVFVAVGKYLAEHRALISNRNLVWAIIISAVFLVGEFILIQNNHWVNRDDCYFALLPLSVALFMLIGQNHVKVTANAMKLRKYSTIIFCSHYSIALIVLHLLKGVMPQVKVLSFDICNLLVFAITLGVCLVLCRLLLWLETQDHFRWVRYSH